MKMLKCNTRPRRLQHWAIVILALGVSQISEPVRLYGQDLGEIIQRALEAQGGERLKAVRSSRHRMKFYDTSNPGSAAISVVEWQYPNRTYSSYEQIGGASICFDGKAAWIEAKLEDGTSYLQNLGAVIVEELTDSTDVLPILSAYRVGRARLLGVTKTDRSETFEVEVLRPSHNIDVYYIDTKSYLTVSRRSLRRQNGKTIYLMFHYFDYRTKSGLTLPRTFEAVSSNGSIVRYEILEAEYNVPLNLDTRCERSPMWHMLDRKIAKEKTIVPDSLAVKGKRINGDLGDDLKVALLFAPDLEAGDPTWTYRSERSMLGSEEVIFSGQRLTVSFRDPFVKSMKRLLKSIFPRLVVVNSVEDATDFDLFLVASYSAQISWLRTPIRSGISSISLAVMVGLVNFERESLGMIKTLYTEAPRKKMSWSAESRTRYLADSVFKNSVHDIALQIRDSERLNSYLQFLAERREKPPTLLVRAEFDDSNGILPNGALDAGETAVVKVDIENAGDGVAFGINAVARQTQGVRTREVTAVGDLAPGAKSTLAIPVSADLSLAAGDLSLRLDIEERRGYGTRPLEIGIPCQEFLKPHLEIVDVALDDSGIRASGNGDGLPSNGEVLEAVVKIRNSGLGTASGVTISVASSLALEMVDSRTVLPAIPAGRALEGRILFGIPPSLKAPELDLELTAVEARGVEAGRVVWSQTWPVNQLQTDLVTSYTVYDGTSAGSQGNRDGEINNGERVEIGLVMRNAGDLTARNVVLEVETASSPFVVSPSRFEVGDLPPAGQTTEQVMLLSVPRRFEGMRGVESVGLKLKIHQDDFRPATRTVALGFTSTTPELTVDFIAPDSTASSSTGKLRIQVSNRGGLTARDVEISVASGSEHLELLNQRGLRRRQLATAVGDMTPGKRSPWLEIPFRTTSGLPVEDIPIRVSIRQADFSAVEDSFSIATTEPSPIEFSVSMPETSPGELVSHVPVSASPGIFFGSHDGKLAYGEDFILWFEVHYPLFLKDVRLRHNNSKIDLGPPDEVSDQRGARPIHWKIWRYNAQVRLVGDENVFEVEAYTPGGQSVSRKISIYRDHEEAKIWLVAVGVDLYDDDSFKDLRYASKDAAAIFNYYRYNMSLPTEQLVLLTNKQATRRNIMGELGTRLSKNARNPQDTVIIYLAGHGYKEADPTGSNTDSFAKYFLPSDSEKEDLYSTALNMDRLPEIVRRIGADRVVVMIDSCFSGAIGGRTILDQGSRGAIDEKFLERIARAGKGRVVLTASGANEAAREWDDLGHGVFTKAVLEALEGAADDNGDLAISVDEVYHYVSARVKKLTGNDQNPEKKAPQQTGDIIIGKREVSHDLGTGKD